MYGPDHPESPHPPGEYPTQAGQYPGTWAGQPELAQEPTAQFAGIAEPQLRKGLSAVAAVMAVIAVALGGTWVVQNNASPAMATTDAGANGSTSGSGSDPVVGAGAIEGADSDASSEDIADQGGTDTSTGEAGANAVTDTSPADPANPAPANPTGDTNPPAPVNPVGNAGNPAPAPAPASDKPLNSKYPTGSTGSGAWDFLGLDGDNKPVNFRQWQGKPVVLWSFSLTCDGCLAEGKSMRKRLDDFRAEFGKDAVIVGIANGGGSEKQSNADAKKFLDRFNINDMDYIVERWGEDWAPCFYAARHKFYLPIGEKNAKGKLTCDRGNSFYTGITKDGKMVTVGSFENPNFDEWTRKQLGR